MGQVGVRAGKDRPRPHSEVDRAEEALEGLPPQQNHMQGG